MADVKSSAEDVIEVLITDHVTGNVIAVRSFDKRTYGRQEVRLTIFQVNEVKKMLGTFSQEHENDLLNCLRA